MVVKRRTTSSTTANNDSNSQAGNNPQSDIPLNDLEDLLHTVQEDFRDYSGTPTHMALETALYASLAFMQSRAEAVWHQQAFRQADKRTKKFFRQLSVLQEIGREIGGLCDDYRASEDTAPEKHPHWVSSMREERRRSIPELFQRMKELMDSDEGASPVPPATSKEVDTSDLETAEVSGPDSKEDPSKSSSVNIQLVSTPDIDTDVHALAMEVHLFGTFRACQNDRPIVDWPNGKAKLLFKYLLTHRQHPVSKEVLMDVFWPDAVPQAARNNLNVTICHLRKSLPKPRSGFSHLLFKDNCYLLNPELTLRIDTEVFKQHFEEGRKLERSDDVEGAMKEYETAVNLYQGDFLAEDRYEDWIIREREEYQEEYLTMLNKLSDHYFNIRDCEACVSTCQKILKLDPCHEESHQRLMRCYHRLGQRNMAIRQYRLCVEALKNELDLEPDDSTVELLREIRG